MFKSIRETLQALHQQKISSVELTGHYLQRMQKYQHLNSFISINGEALSEAARADEQISRKQILPLTGLPMAHKDIFCTTSLPTTCGSRMLANFQSPYQAGAVQKLQDAGSIMLGKTNMDEFAMGSSNEKSYFGPVKNPWDVNRVPGGSSGGSAAAVAAGLTPFATGSDTGGSIRQPAAFCGISGIKPTYGLISRFGMVAFASSLDQAGPMAASADDLAIVLQSMTGFDARDSTSLQQPIPDYSLTLQNSLRGLRIGVPSCFFDSNSNPAILNALRTALQLFEEAGAHLVEIELKLQPSWVPAYYVIACAEASSNLSRYDGVRYGYRSSQCDNLRNMITASRSEAFGAEVKRRILTGTYVLSSGYFDDYYLQALKIRRMIQNELVSQLTDVDVIIGPTTPECAFKIGEHKTDTVQDYLADVFTVAANLAGLPAMSIPAGFSEGLPIGMQLMGSAFSEARLLNIAHQYQQMTDWHQKTNRDLS